MGLTGCILTATLRLVPVETAYVEVDYRRTANLGETLEQFTATNRDFRFSVAWIDCLAGGKLAGPLGADAGQLCSPLGTAGPVCRPIPCGCRAAAGGRCRSTSRRSC